MVGTIESETALAKRYALDFIKSAYANDCTADRGLSPDVPWPAIFRLASAEACLAALCDCILSKDTSQLGEMAPLLGLFRDKGRERNKKIGGVLDETLRRLAQRGVEAIALKGGAFLAAENVCSRSMVDLDLLVRSRDKKKAFQALTSEGYKLLPDNTWYESLNHHHAPPLLDPSGYIAVEIHTRLAPNFDNPLISADVLFSNTQTGSIGNTSVSIPSETHRLIHLIIHAMVADNGYWLIEIRLRDLIDLLEVQKSGRVDWQCVRATFAQIGFEKRAAGFLLAAELLLFPAFEAPKWAKSSRRWTKRAVRAFFEPDLFRTRRAVGQLLADIEVIAQNPKRLRIVLSPKRLKQFVAARCLPFGGRGS
jgi:hypothetical protein